MGQEPARRGRQGPAQGSEVTLSELPIADRAPVLATYQAKLGKAVASHFKALPEPTDHPVFRI